MKIENVVYEPEIFKYSRKSIYKEIYATIEKMDFKKQIRVTLDKPVKNLYGFSLHFRRHKAEFKVRVRQADKHGLVWNIAKFDLDE